MLTLYLCTYEYTCDPKYERPTNLREAFLRRSGEMSWRNGRNRNAFCDGVLRLEDPHEEPMLEGEFCSAGESTVHIRGESVGTTYTQKKSIAYSQGLKIACLSS
jgi:hypothetical protein